MFTDRNWHIDSMWGVHRHFRRTQLLVFHKKMTDVSRLFWIHSLCDCIMCRSSVAFAVVGAAKWTSRIRAQGRSSDTQAKVIFHLPFLLFSFLFIFCTLCTNFRVALPPYLHLATSEMWCWSGGRGILKKKTLCVNSIVYCYNGAQRYEQFLHVGRLYRALILLGLALSSDCLCVWSSWCYILIFFAYILLFTF